MYGASPRNKISVDSYILSGASYHQKKILQWGTTAPTSNSIKYSDRNFPISFKKEVCTVVSWDIQDEIATEAHTSTVTWNKQATTLTKVRLITDIEEIGMMGFLAIGY